MSNEPPTPRLWRLKGVRREMRGEKGGLGEMNDNLKMRLFEYDT
jgi:hypothetical protein